jgi:hypothetical protein
MKFLQFWARIWPLLLILGVTVIAWVALSHLALHARVHDSGEIARGLKIEDYKQGKDWATELLGLAGAFAGFLGVAAAQRLGLTRTERDQNAEGAFIGILAGATLLGLGGWPVPAALAAMVTGGAVVRLAHALRGQE